jgi:hypothetical protein
MSNAAETDCAAEGYVVGLRARAREARLALTKAEASASLSMSVDSFERYVLPAVRVVRRGRLVLVPVVELERWLERESERTLR